jgi:hypothetical protein
MTCSYIRNQRFSGWRSSVCFSLMSYEIQTPKYVKSDHLQVMLIMDLRFLRMWLWRVLSSGLQICLLSPSCWLFILINLTSWIWRRCVPPKYRLSFSRLGAIYLRRQTFSMVVIFLVVLSSEFLNFRLLSKELRNEIYRPILLNWCITLSKNLKTYKLRGLSPQANYTDRRNRRCRRSSADFCGLRVLRGQRNGFPRPLISVF